MKTILLLLFFYLTLSFSASAQCKDTIYTVVEQMPQYPGGDAEMMKYIMSTKTDSISDLGEITQGRLLFKFYIDKVGQVRDVELIGSNHPSIDSSFKKAIENMPRWKPGKQDGKKVCVRYMLPLCLRFQK